MDVGWTDRTDKDDISEKTRSKLCSLRRKPYCQSNNYIYIFFSFLNRRKVVFREKDIQEISRKISVKHSVFFQSNFEVSCFQELIDYEAFCGSSAHDKIEPVHILDAADRIEAKDYATCRENREGGQTARDAVLIDTRPPHEFAIAHLPEAISEFNRLFNLLSSINYAYNFDFENLKSK